MSEVGFPLVQRYEFFYSSFLIHKVFFFFFFFFFQLIYYTLGMSMKNTKNQTMTMTVTNTFTSNFPLTYHKKNKVSFI